MKSTKKTLLALSFIGALIVGYAPASAADVVKLKTMAAHSQATAWAWPVYEKWIEAVKRETNGRVELEYYAPGQLVPYIQFLEAARVGVADIVLVTPGYYQNEFPLSNIWNYMYRWPDAVTSWRMWDELYDQYMDMDFQSLNLRCLGGWPSAGYHLFTIDKPIERMEDVAGLKIRSNNATTSGIIEAMGGIPVFMSGSKVPDALAKGMLNGNPISYHWATAIPIWEHGKPGYWTITGSFPQGISCVSVSLNPRNKWNKVLSEEDREVVARLTNQFTRDLSQAVDDVAAKAKEQLVANGVVYSEWPKSERQRLVDATSHLLGEALDFAKKEAAPGQFMVDAMLKWLEDNQ